MTAKTSSGLRHCFVLGGGGVALVAKHDSYMVRLQVGVRVCVLESGTQNKWIRGLKFCVVLKPPARRQGLMWR